MNTQYYYVRVVRFLCGHFWQDPWCLSFSMISSASHIWISISTVGVFSYNSNWLKFNRLMQCRISKLRVSTKVLQKKRSKLINGLARVAVLFEVIAPIAILNNFLPWKILIHLYCRYIKIMFLFWKSLEGLLDCWFTLKQQ